MASASWNHLFFKLFLICIVSTHVSFSDEVHTTGIGFTRETALENALKHGLEKKIEAYLPGHTYTKNKQVLAHEFLNNLSHYILSKKIHAVKEKFGCFEIEATAEIDNLTLKDDLTAHGFAIRSISKPSIIILVDEYHETSRLSEQTASFTLKEILVKNGYTILDLPRESLTSINNRSSDNANSITESAHAGFENSADLVLRGLVQTGRATPVDIYGKQQSTVPVQMNVEVIRTDNARIIASNTLNIRKNATTDYSALQFALKSAAEATGKKLVADLDAFCTSEEYSSRHFELLVNGADYASANRLESAIKTLTFIKDVKLGYLEDQKAVYGISVHGSLTSLRKELSTGKITGLEIESLSRGRIVAVYRNDSLQIISHPAASDVEITSLHIEKLFPSKIRYYATHPAGHFTLNSTTSVSNLQVRLSLPELLIQPLQITINQVDPGENNIDLFIVPAIEKLRSIMETRIFQGQLELQYTMAGTVHTRSLMTPVTIHGVNGMNWSTPEVIAGFITNEDPAIRTFSRQIVQGISSGSEFNQDLVNAIAVHAAVRSYGIHYVKDPSPTSDKVIDMVQYPAQTLFHRTGDCDDLSVLYCALLSSLGIPVALLSYDDHVLFMFSTGIFEKNRLALSPDTTMTIVHDKKLWIPIEATDMHSSFIENWHTTAKKFHDAIQAGRAVKIIDVQDAWKNYPPVSLVTERFDNILKPVNDEVQTELHHLRDVNSRQYAAAIAILRAIKKKDIEDPALLNNKIGLLSVHSGDYRNALRFFKRAYNSNKSPKIRSNYACALLLSGRDNAASGILDQIYQKDSEGKIAVNRALCKYVASRDTAALHEFYQCMLDAVSVIQADTAISEIIRFEITGQDSLRASNASPANAQKLDVTILKQYIKAASDAVKQRSLSGITTESSSGTRITGTTTETSTGTTADNMLRELTPFGGLRGAGVEDLLRLIDLLFWFDF